MPIKSNVIRSIALVNYTTICFLLPNNIPRTAVFNLCDCYSQFIMPNCGDKNYCHISGVSVKK